MSERVNQFLSSLKQIARQFARTIYSAHPLGAINEASALLGELTWQQWPNNFKNTNNSEDYRFMRHVITWPSLLFFSWYLSAWQYLQNGKNIGFLSTQAIFMRDFINKLYDKNQPEVNPWSLNIMLTTYVLYAQPEYFAELMCLFALNKLAFTLANPLTQYLRPMSHALENHMHFTSILFIQSIKQQAVLGKASQWLTGSLQGGFSLLSFLMFALNAAAKEAGDHTNATIAPMALLLNATCIFFIKQCFSSWNKTSKALTNQQLRALYLVSFVSSYLAFQFGTELLYNLMRPAKHYCMTYPDTSQPMFFTLERWSLASWNKINVSATIDWNEMPRIHSDSATNLIIPRSLPEDSPHQSATFCTTFNLFKQNHSNTYCSEARAMPTPMT